MIAGVLRALPDLASAALFLALWIEPQRFGLEWFRAGVLALLLEFFVLHASGFLAVMANDPESPRRTRLLWVGGLGAGYLIFVALLGYSLDAEWMIAAFVWFCVSKLLGVLRETPTERDRFHAIAGWAMGVVLYLGAVFATVTFDIPELGATAALRDAAGFDAEGGVWEAEPQRALAGAALYFALAGIGRAVLAHLFARSARPPEAKSPP